MNPWILAGAAFWLACYYNSAWLLKGLGVM